ncbi:hypothetical protein AKUH4B114J_01220 [Apilactobacillus kunkeei]|uniref:DUF805 domain-containing protein n=1 Tax=Apilactobacillus TaxID=2767877 RepID=UPI001C6F8CDC|nr:MULTISPECIES: DUF805 domain-containing protein [Apilactobacillus]MBX8455002.1 DUF805 domain-containing protein [Apilactobacillus kunkeei]MCK8618510.1 DUF805 domain-containing protein [Apilactobacillus kunkeei]MDN2613524.1 DUF805 domain-containing protein [Apilactobacillus sp. EABW-1NA]QYU54542.1 DUF805 domain-containing protein [Apilactobacillus kunkeei]CAI2554437.1 hypothetical protein AKUH4B102A_01160 [Apilactobacillus kunkeei]
MEIKYCSKCGTELSVDDSFCSNCGTRQSYIENNTISNLEKDSTKRIRFTDAVTKCLKNAFNLSGVATRAEYWWFYLFKAIALFGILYANAYVGINYRSAIVLSKIHPAFLFAISVILGLVSSVIAIASLSVAVRRLHDTNLSGRFICLGFIPFLGIIALIVMFCQKSVVNGNKYINVGMNNSKKIRIIVLYVIYSMLAAWLYIGMYISEMHFMLYR